MSAFKRLHVLSQYAYLYLDSADVCVLGFLKGDVVATNRNPQLRVYGRREFCMLPIADPLQGSFWGAEGFRKEGLLVLEGIFVLSNTACAL